MRPTSKEMLETARMPFPLVLNHSGWEGGLFALVLDCLVFFPVYIV